MLDLQDILQEYPQHLQGFKRHILREYLQCIILTIIYKSDYADALVFLGGTALRIVYNSMRFSEDLDFDNKSLSLEDFSKLSIYIKKRLELEGYLVETREVAKGAFRCYIRFPNLLFDYGLSGYSQEKILIQLDTAPQHYEYNSEHYLLKKFGLFGTINVVPMATILSQKIHTIFERKRTKGRDYFDVVFLFSKTKPDYKYLTEKLQIPTQEILKSRLSEHIKELDFDKMAEDVSHFLTSQDQNDRVLLFKTFVESL